MENWIITVVLNFTGTDIEPPLLFIQFSYYYIHLGAEVDAIGGELMSTPMHWATRQGHTQIVVMLLQYGADYSIKDREGYTCLHLAAQFGFTAIVAYLIAKGQSVNSQVGMGWGSVQGF